MDNLLEAKKKLYWELLNIPVEHMTDNEADIIYLLAKDEQIQKLFQQNKQKK